MPCCWNDMSLLIMMDLSLVLSCGMENNIVKRVKYQNIFQAVLIHVPYTNYIICSI